MFEVGRVFTPLHWACWLIEASGAFDVWRNGGTIFDPTCGDGSFLEGFVALGIKAGCLDTTSIRRIYGNEVVTSDKTIFLDRIKDKYGIIFPEENFQCVDYFNNEVKEKFDCLVGNPPWANFTDLPELQKNNIKIIFQKYGLVSNKKDVLLGGSRADIASLVVQKSIKDNLVRGGLAAFWLPKSVFFNEGANKNFREFKIGAECYKCMHVYLFDNDRKVVFPDISTSYCAAVFKSGIEQSYPVHAQQYVDKSSWTETLFSPPTNDHLGGWQEKDWSQKQRNVHKLRLHANQKPRQGVNTCGANEVFIFEQAEEAGVHDLRLTNALGQVVTLPKALVFPLITRHTFRGRKEPDRWILVPYDRSTGRPLTDQQLREYGSAKEYLEKHRQKLISRKGVLIGSQIAKGAFWSMMGVGPYSFAPWKIVWESYGKKEFRPMKIEGHWQGNQAMHAFIPCQNLSEADRVINSLGKMDIEAELLRHGMEGTTNWAQPGRMSRMFEFSGTLL